MFELTENMIRLCDLEETDDEGIYDALAECWFDIDEKFGTHINGEEDIWINLYVTSYNPRTKEFNVTYTIDDAKNYDTFDYVPTENERKMFIKLMEKLIEDDKLRRREDEHNNFLEKSL